MEINVYVSDVHFRADEWDVNKWAWEGMLKVISKGEECIIRLEDKTTGKIIFKLLKEQLYFSNNYYFVQQ